MDLRDTPEEAAFRAQAREWLAANVPDPLRSGRPRDDVEAARDWSRRLSEAGYAGLTWPKEYGGGGLSVKQQFILNEEMAEARAPGVGGMGVSMVGPTLMAHGTD
ncbi:MAG: acyl-CoA dehydrogenase family protein, partial [Gaiellaceae bacterium]